MKPTTRTVDSGFAKAAGSIAKFFDAAVGSKLVKLVRLRYLDDAPLCLETTYLPPSFETLIDRDINGSLYATLRQEFHRAPAQGHKTFEVCYASQNEAFLLNVERGQALILITDYVYDTDGRPLHRLQAHPAHRPRQIHRAHRLAHQTRQTVPNERFTCGFIKSQASMAQMPTSPGNTRRPSSTVPAQNIQYRKSK
ncbi:MAG: UTRA domain-containing protein [Collinsella sp.]